MFFAGMKHLTKGDYVTSKGNTIKNPSAKSAYHYITRTAQFANCKDGETVEFAKHGNMPDWTNGQPENFWETADEFERGKGRVATTMVIALPNHLTPQQRQELAENLIKEFCDKHNFPYSAAIHSQKGLIGDQDQPHLHIMYSERGLIDGIDRGPQQFFKQWNRKHPEAGGTRKLTADVLGSGKYQVDQFRNTAERQINATLEKYAPTKIMMIKWEPVEVPSFVSALSTEKYNQKFGTQLKEIPMIPSHMLYSTDEDVQKKVEQLKQQINADREYNQFELYQQYYYAHLEAKALKNRSDRAKILEEAKTHQACNAVDVCKNLPQTSQLQHVLELAQIQDRMLEQPDKFIDAMSQKRYALVDLLRNEPSETAICEAISILENDRKWLEIYKQQGFVKNQHENFLFNLAKDSIAEWMESLQTVTVDELKQQAKLDVKSQEPISIDPILPKPQPTQQKDQDYESSSPEGV